MEYVLAKDLPFAKAGAEVWVDDTGIYTQRNENGLKTCLDTLSYRDSDPKSVGEEVQRLITDGWIKQVKPREFWIKIFTVGDRPIRVCEDKAPLIYGLEDGYDVIKVREVLE